MTNLVEILEPPSTRFAQVSMMGYSDYARIEIMMTANPATDDSIVGGIFKISPNWK